MKFAFNALHKILFALIVCLGLYYVCDYIQEGYSGRRRRGGHDRRHHGGHRRHHGRHGRHGRHHYYSPRNVFYPTYDDSDVYVYPVYDYRYTNQDGFLNYLRWLFGYPPTLYR